jgi:hypothetical protein
MKRWVLIGTLLISLFVAGIVRVEAGQNCGTPLIPCTGTRTQATTLFNTQTTGGATTAVTVTLTAVPGARTHVYSIGARCNTAAATSDLLISDGGTTLWSSGPLAVIAIQPQYFREWATPITGATNSQVLVTLAACTAGTGTLIVQADRY